MQNAGGISQRRGEEFVYYGIIKFAVVAPELNI